MAKNITGTLKYLESGQLVTDWGEGNFLALKFTNNEPDKIKTIKVGLDPSQGSGLVPLDEDMNGVFKITNNNTQKFVVESYDEDDRMLKRDEYSLEGLSCMPKPEPEYEFNSDVITDGSAYGSSYFIAPRQFTISGLTAEDTVSLTYGVRTMVLTLTGSYNAETEKFEGAISGVNTDLKDYDCQLKVNDTVVCSFILLAKEGVQITDPADKTITFTELDDGCEMTVITHNTAEPLTSSNFVITYNGNPLNIINDVIPISEEAPYNEYAIEIENPELSAGTYECNLNLVIPGASPLGDTLTIVMEGEPSQNNTTLIWDTFGGVTDPVIWYNSSNSNYILEGNCDIYDATTGDVITSPTDITNAKFVIDGQDLTVNVAYTAADKMYFSHSYGSEEPSPIPTTLELVFDYDGVTNTYSNVPIENKL